MLGVIVHRDKGQRIDGKTEVKTKVVAIEPCHIRIAHLHVLDVIKYAAARARDLTEILMTIQRFVLFAQALCLRDELLSKPRRRHVQICRPMHNTVVAIE